MDQQFLKDQVKGKIKNSTANYGPKKWGSSKRCVFFVQFFSKNQYFKSGFQKKWSVLFFFSLAGFLLKKNGTKAAVSGPYQGRIRPKTWNFIFFHLVLFMMVFIFGFENCSNEHTFFHLNYWPKKRPQTQKKSTIQTAYR